MKTVFMVALALIVLNVTAQEPQNKNQDRKQFYKDMSAEEMASLQTKKMTLHLDLSDKQQKEIYDINLKNAYERKIWMEKHQTMSDNKKFANPSKENRLKMMNARLDHQIEMKDKMKSILNDEQFAKWEKAQTRNHAKRMDTRKTHHMKRRQG